MLSSLLCIHLRSIKIGQVYELGQFGSIGNLPSWSRGNEPRWGGVSLKVSPIVGGRPKDMVAWSARLCYMILNKCNLIHRQEVVRAEGSRVSQVHVSLSKLVSLQLVTINCQPLARSTRWRDASWSHVTTLAHRRHQSRHIQTKHFSCNLVSLLPSTSFTLAYSLAAESWPG